MPQSFAAMYLHLVFSTKDRQPLLADPVLRQRIHANLQATARILEAPCGSIGGVGDHVHLLISQSRKLSVAEMVKELKRVSSLKAKSLSPQLSDFAWQRGYGAFSIGQGDIPAVQAYIACQEQHHRKETFQEEFLRLLAEHELTWDERYIWD